MKDGLAASLPPPAGESRGPGFVGLTILRLQPWLAPALVGLLLIGVRLWVAWRSVGSNDAVLWRDFAREIESIGLLQEYRTKPIFNHPPLMGYWAMLLLKLDRLLGVRFEVLLKVLPIVGDCLSAFLLYRIWQRRAGTGLLAAFLFAGSLVSILVTGYHGNTDSLCAALALLSVYFFDRRRLALAGLALGAALNVKLIPVFIVPVLLLQCRSRKELFSFGGPLAACALPFLPVLIGAGEPFYRHVIAYNPNRALWGLPGILHAASFERLAGQATAGISAAFWSSGRWLILMVALAIGVLGRRRRTYSAFELAFLAMAAFLLLAPGFGMQYLVHVAGLLLVVTLVDGAVFGLLAGLFLLSVYAAYWTGAVPWYSRLTGDFPRSGVFVGYVAWAILARAAIRTVVARWRSPATADARGSLAPGAGPDVPVT